MSKPLTLIQIQAAELAAKGRTDVDIAEELERSRQWVQSQKRLPEFQELVSELTEKYKETIVTGTQADLLGDIRENGRRLREARDMIFNASHMLMEKLVLRLNELEPEELKASQMPQAIKQAADSYKIAIEMDFQISGVEQILKRLQEIKKLIPSESEDNID